MPVESATATVSVTTSAETPPPSSTVSKSPRKRRQTVFQPYHKFVLGNPCKPCEWHIEKDVRIFAVFDFNFQCLFLYPTIIFLKQYIKEWQKPREVLTLTTTSTPSMEQFSSSTTTTESHPLPPSHCDAEKTLLAVAYCSCDLANLGLGILSDLLIFIATCQRSTCFSLAASILFLIVGFLRECLHITAATIHILRCTPLTYPYEFTVRTMCHYFIWGFWIVAEYMVWVKRGRNFVPRRGQMEPPIIELKVEMSTTTTGSSVSSWDDDDDDINPSDLQGSSVGTLSGTGGGDDALEGGPKKKKRRSRRKSKRRSKKRSDLDAEGGGGGGQTTAENDPNASNQKKTPA